MYLPDEKFPLLHWKKLETGLYGIRWLKEHDPEWVNKTKELKLPDIFWRQNLLRFEVTTSQNDPYPAVVLKLNYFRGIRPSWRGTHHRWVKNALAHETNVISWQGNRLTISLGQDGLSIQDHPKNEKDKAIPFLLDAEEFHSKKPVEVVKENSWRMLYESREYRDNLNDELKVLLYDDAVIPGITQADRDTLYCNTFDEKGFGISCELKNGQLGTFFLSWPKYLIEMEKRRRW